MARHVSLGGDNNSWTRSGRTSLGGLNRSKYGAPTGLPIFNLLLLLKLKSLPTFAKPLLASVVTS